MQQITVNRTFLFSFKSVKLAAMYFEDGLLPVQRQFCITFLAVFALFFTCVAVSVQAEEHHWPLNPHAGNLLSVIAPIHNLECTQHEPSSASNHQCCASICLLKMPCAHCITTHSLPISSLALIGQDDNQKAITRIQTLFRPPIITS